MQDSPIPDFYHGFLAEALEDAMQRARRLCALLRMAVGHVGAREGEGDEPIRSDRMLVRPRPNILVPRAEECLHVRAIFVRDERRPLLAAERLEHLVERSMQ